MAEAAAGADSLVEIMAEDVPAATAGPATLPTSSSGDADAATKKSNRLSGIQGVDFEAPVVPVEDPSAQPAKKGWFTGDTWSKYTAAASSSLKEWSNKAVSELKDSGKKLTILKQKFSESMGKGTATIDENMKEKIEELRKTERLYVQLCTLCKKFTARLRNAAEAQIAVGSCFEALGDLDEDLKPFYACHQRIQDVMSKSTVGLVESLNYFTKKVEEFNATTMKPAFATFADYEIVRLEYDAARTPYEALKETQSPKLQAAEERFLSAYNKLSEAKDAVNAKVAELTAAKNNALKQQCRALCNAYAMFQAGNQAGIDEAIATLQKASGGPDAVAADPAEAAVGPDSGSLVALGEPPF